MPAHVSIICEIDNPENIIVVVEAISVAGGDRMHHLRTGEVADILLNHDGRIIVSSITEHTPV
jgi:hypothetical protein